jgi:hypothetical protein
MKVLVGAAVLAMMAGSVMAQTTGSSWYIVQDSSTKKCSVVSERPTATTMTVVGDGYTTRQEAETAIKTTTVCTQ